MTVPHKSTCKDCKPGTPEAKLCHWCLLEINEERAAESMELIARRTAEEVGDEDVVGFDGVGRRIVYELVTNQGEDLDQLRAALRYALGVRGDA